MKTATSTLRTWAAGHVWLIKPDALDAYLATAPERFALLAAERRAMFADGGSMAGETSAAEPAMEVVDGVAIIPANGLLVESQSECEDSMLSLFGGTSYGSIRARAALATRRADVRAAMIEIDTPGGTQAGVESAGQAIKSLSAAKPTVAFVRNMGDSAGYWLATSAPRIVAEGRLSEVGSIGVARKVIDARRGMTAAGIDLHNFTSSNAPNKWPDVATEAGRQQIQRELDEAEALFLEHVAVGRNVSVAKVLDDFGGGACLLAEDALSVGMIDAIHPRATMLAGLAEQGRAASLARATGRVVQSSRTAAVVSRSLPPTVAVARRSLDARM